MGRILVEKYGQYPWILQIMEAVQGAVQLGIEQLSGSMGPAANSQPGDIQAQGYNMPARTREDVVQQNPQILQQPSDVPLPRNDQLVQQGLQEGNNDMFALLSRAQDPAQQQLGQSLPNQPQPQPMREVQQTKSGLVMPDGPAPQETSRTQDDESLGWLL